MQVVISKQCHCVIKNNMTESIICANKDEALKKAKDLIIILEKETCNTHLFFIREEDDKIVVDSKYNPNKSY